jgi:hypothetical protein
MLADFFTKPLQGMLFRKFRDILLGQVHTSETSMVSLIKREERVGESMKQNVLSNESAMKVNNCLINSPMNIVSPKSDGTKRANENGQENAEPSFGQLGSVGVYSTNATQGYCTKESKDPEQSAVLQKNVL